MVILKIIKFLTEIKNKILNLASIKILTKKLIAHSKKMINNTDELKSLGNHLKELQFEIDNIVNAISQGMFHISFKERCPT